MANRQKLYARGFPAAALSHIMSDVAAFLGVAMADAKATNFAEIWCPVMGSVTADVPQTLNEFLGAPLWSVL